MTANCKDAQSLHVARRGTGLPLVALHGYGVDHRVLLPLDAALENVGKIERHYLDLPGFGQSPALTEPGGLQQLADSVVTYIHANIGERPFALLGHSLGGLLARYVRSQMPDQVLGMAFLAPAVFTDPEERTLPKHEVIDRDADLLAELTDDEREKFTELAARQIRPVWDLFRDYSLPGIEAADSDAMKNLSAHYRLDDGEPDEQSGPFTGPTLMLTGRQDQIVGFEDQFELVKAWYPRATFAALNGAGHNVHFDCLGISQALIEQWASEFPR